MGDSNQRDSESADPEPRAAARASGGEPAGMATVDGIDSYDSAVRFLYSRINYERIGMPPYNAGNYRLDRMRALLEILGNPHTKYKIVHIAGTKGKGTTATLVASCLNASGITTGLYTSPHLEKIEERICLAGNHVSPEDFTALTRRVAEAARKLEATEHGLPTFFELTTAMGMLHFALGKADVVVLEVGLGGRLDSTNVCSPIVSAITPIGLDHQAQLGDTIDKIAKEKAGIVKEGTPLVCTAPDGEAQNAILEVAKEKGVECLLINRDFSFAWRPVLNETTAAEVLFQPSAIQLGRFEGIWQTRLLGQHQGGNVAGALAILGLLSDLGVNVDVERSRQAIAESQPACRLELLSTNPFTVVDTAHTPESIAAALEALRVHFPKRRIVAVFATSKDKNFSHMMALLKESCSAIVVTKYQGNPRGVPTDELMNASANCDSADRDSGELGDCCVSSAATPKSALDQARGMCDDHLLLVIGSFFLAGELRPLILDAGR